MPSDTLIPAPTVYGSNRLASEIDDVHVECLAISIVRHGHHIRRHRHSDLYQFFVIQQCNADCQLDSQRVHLSGAGLLVVPAMVVHQFDFSPGTIGQVVSISHAMLREFERLTGDKEWMAALATPRWLPIDGSSEVFACGEALLRLFNEPSRRRLHLTAAAVQLVSGTVSLCDRQARERATIPGVQQQLVDAFIADIERHYASTDAVADYCERLKVTERTLRRATTARMALSPVALVHQRKCLEAQRLLRFTALSIAEVAYELGFADPSYFSRRFKKVTGMSPRDVRM